MGSPSVLVIYASTPHPKQALADGRDLSWRLTDKVVFPVSVRPVLAISNAKPIVDRRATSNRLVAVVNSTQLGAWLLSQTQQLSDTKLQLIKLGADEPETWHIDSRAADTSG